MPEFAKPLFVFGVFEFESYKNSSAKYEVVMDY